tara:strand:- start:23915 stop:24229 length:315 start_codon:yes stop_codon:yes gene_type:complete
MSRENVETGEAFYLNNNERKSADNHPDFVGRLVLSTDELRGLIEIHERDTEGNREPLLQIDLSGWKGTSKRDGTPYLYMRHEVYTGPRKAPGPKQSRKDSSDWI